MADVINVAIGAMLGVILADSPIFKSDILKIEDMYPLTLFLLLVIMFACNIWITTRSYARNHYHLFYISIALYIAMEVWIFLMNTYDTSLLPNKGLSHFLRVKPMFGRSSFSLVYGYRRMSLERY
jgi:glucan phosphoethanolaminetransferase (alkaline phosphatase superfamily)